MARHLDNWIKAYLAYTNEQESPEVFHKWVAISVISSALRRRVFFNMDYFLLYPNLYIVLVSPPGACKKSTAMRMGRGILSQNPEVKFTTDSVTRERLIQDMQQSLIDGHSSMTAFQSEFSSFLTSSGVDMVVFLTDIFDSPDEWSHRTKIGGTNTIVAPCLNLMAGTTPSSLSTDVSMETIGIGLTSRMVFVYSETPRARKPIPRMSPEQRKLQHLLVEDLAQIGQISGEYKFTEEAEKFYEEWYLERFKNPNPLGDNRLDGYFERKPMILLKVAMVVAASQRDATVFEVQDIKDAMALLAEVEKEMPNAFKNLGKNPLRIDIDDILHAIYGASDGISVGELQRRFKHNVRKEELMEILETLLAMGVVRMSDMGRYYPTTTP